MTDSWNLTSGLFNPILSTAINTSCKWITGTQILEGMIRWGSPFHNCNFDRTSLFKKHSRVALSTDTHAQTALCRVLDLKFRVLIKAERSDLSLKRSQGPYHFFFWIMSDWTILADIAIPNISYLGIASQWTALMQLTNSGTFIIKN